MATYYLRTDGNDGNAGTSDTAGGAWRSISYAASQVVAGDTVYVRGTAGNASSFPTSSLDYTTTGYINMPDGSAGTGTINWVGLGSMPTIGTNGECIFDITHTRFVGLYFVATSDATGGGNGRFLESTQCLEVSGCVFNTNNLASFEAIRVSTGDVVRGNVIYGAGTSASSTAYGVRAFAGENHIVGNRIYNMRGAGVYLSGSAYGSRVSGNLVYGCYGDGILSDHVSQYTCGIDGNTVHNNGGHGIRLAATNGAAAHAIFNNCITSHTGTGKAGISVATSGSDARKRFWVCNNVWNNASNYSNVTADSTDISVDPGYADAANGDFTPSNTALKVAFPTAF